MGGFVTLDRADGPECPNCGCRDAKILREATPRPEGWQPEPGVSWFDQQMDTQGRAKCSFCRLEFLFKETLTEPEVEFPDGVSNDPDPHPAAPIGCGVSAPAVPAKAARPVCLECGTTMKVSSTRPAFRWYKCDCGETRKVPR
jgi:hypothetical protein